VRRHLACASGGFVGLVLGLAAVAYAGDSGQAAVTGDPAYDLIAHVVSGGGLPAVLAVLGWWLRGSIGAGLPIVVSLADEDRRRLDRALRHWEREPDSDSDEPPKPKAAA
jgi:hypothetical protein